MKRPLSESEESYAEPLPLDIILVINEFVVDVGIVFTGNLLDWHSVNKSLYQRWSDPAYLVKLLTKSGDKSKELFQKTQNGIYHTIHTNHFLYRHIFPMVAILHERIISHIQLSDSSPLENHIYKSYPDESGMFLRPDDLVPVALRKRSTVVLKILSDYMCCKCGWLLEIHEDCVQVGFNSKTMKLICLRPVEKLYAKAVTK